VRGCAAHSYMFLCSLANALAREPRNALGLRGQAQCANRAAAFREPTRAPARTWLGKPRRPGPRAPQPRDLDGIVRYLMARPLRNNSRQRCGGPHRQAMRANAG